MTDLLDRVIPFRRRIRAAGDSWFKFPIVSRSLLWNDRSGRLSCLTIGLDFVLADAWIGSYTEYSQFFNIHREQWDTYVCIVPCVPIHFTYERGWCPEGSHDDGASVD